MRLLVSVRSAAEVAQAVAGGADIVDAKEPSRGSLGAVSGPVLQAIARCLPGTLPLSVALGDPGDSSALAVAMAVLEGLDRRPAPAYIKIGLSAAGIGAEAVLRAAVATAARSPLRPSVIAVAYADHVAAGVPAPENVTRLAQASGAHGVLLDTWGKDGRDLFHHVAEARLRAWVEAAQAAGLLVALAGSLTVDGVRAVAKLSADIVGVRGAACIGGRDGMVVEARVAELKAALAGSVAPLEVTV
ncbi:MAG: (5-formylfuran-3-yl)methyl phosphate synthase [Gemmatimonadales bacterium]